MYTLTPTITQFQFCNIKTAFYDQVSQDRKLTLPKGRKYIGRGNVLFFPLDLDYFATVLWKNFLEEVAFKLSLKG